MEAYESLIDTDKIPTEMKRSMAQCLFQSVSGDIEVTESYSSALIELIMQHGEKYAFQHVVPFVKNRVSEIAFAIAFLA